MSKRESRLSTGLTNRDKRLATAVAMLDTPNSRGNTRFGELIPNGPGQGHPMKHPDEDRKNNKQCSSLQRSRSQCEVRDDGTSSGSNCLPRENRITIMERRPQTRSQGGRIETAGSEMSWAFGNSKFGTGVRRLQKHLHKDEAIPFSVMQDAVRMHREKGADCRTQLTESIFEATGQRPSNEVVEELAICCEGSDNFKFGSLAEALWQENLVRGKDETKYRKHSTPVKHFFHSKSGPGFYNDNVRPSVNVFGVKKGSSSVQYDLFTNQNRRQIVNSPVPHNISQAVAQTLHIVPDQHPVTSRPMDPYLSYITMKQGKRCGIRQRNLPINIITLQPHDKCFVNKEWQSVPTVSLAFSKLHTGHMQGAEWRNRVF